MRPCPPNSIDKHPECMYEHPATPDKYLQLCLFHVGNTKPKQEVSGLNEELRKTNLFYNRSNIQ